jgi:hypothetical protein
LEVQKLGAHPDHEELADLFFGGELAQSLLRPFFTLAVEMDGAGLLVFLFGERRANDGAEDGEEQANPSAHEQTIAWGRVSGLRCRAHAQGGPAFPILGIGWRLALDLLLKKNALFRAKSRKQTVGNFLAS